MSEHKILSSEKIKETVDKLKLLSLTDPIILSIIMSKEIRPLIDLASALLQSSKVMPEKVEIQQNYGDDFVQVYLDKKYNEAIDLCTLAHLKAMAEKESYISRLNAEIERLRDNNKTLQECLDSQTENALKLLHKKDELKKVVDGITVKKVTKLFFKEAFLDGLSGLFREPCSCNNECSRCEGTGFILNNNGIILVHVLESLINELKGVGE